MTTLTGIYSGDTAAICTASNGDIFVVAVAWGTWSYLKIFKSTNNGDSFSVVASVIDEDISGYALNDVDADMDASDNIHIIVKGQSAWPGEVGICYNKFITSNNSWLINTTYWEDVKPDWDCDSIAIGVDESDKPHILFIYSNKGYYSNRISGSWSTPEIMFENITPKPDNIRINVVSSTVIEAFLGGGAYAEAPQKFYRRTRTSGSWGSLTEWDYSGCRMSYTNIVRCNGVEYALGDYNYNSGDNDLYINNEIIAPKHYSGDPDHIYSGLAVNETYDYLILFSLFWVNGAIRFGYYVKRVTGSSGWIGPIVIYTGDEPPELVTEFSLLNDHYGTKTNLVYSSAYNNAIFIQIETDFETETSSIHAYMTGEADTQSSIPAIVQSGTMVRGSISCYCFAEGERLVPDEDIANVSTWVNEEGGTTLYPSLADSNDGTFVHNAQMGAGDYFEVGLTAPTLTPDNTGQHKIVWKYQRNVGSSTITLKIDLKQDSTVIATDQVVISDTLTEHTLVLSQDEVNDITDYTHLRFRVTVVSIT